MLLRNDKQPITGSVERGTRSPHGLKELAYMERKSAGNKAHLQPVTHFFIYIGVGIAHVVFQRSGTKFRYVTGVMPYHLVYRIGITIDSGSNNRIWKQG